MPRTILFPLTLQIRTAACAALLFLASSVFGQGQEELTHRRGRLWETVRNDGWIGSLGAWDFLVSTPLGLFPGFDGYTHPVGNENDAVNTFENSNMHNFRSGCWIVVKDLMIPGGPPVYAPMPAAYELYASGLQQETYGIENVRAPSVMATNYAGDPGFNPLLPEEMIRQTWHTNTGITVTRRSSVWSYPGYRDFIIYDYVFKNTADYVSTLTGVVVPNPADTLKSQVLHNV